MPKNETEEENDGVHGQLFRSAAARAVTSARKALDSAAKHLKHQTDKARRNCILEQCMQTKVSQCREKVAKHEQEMLTECHQALRARFCGALKKYRFRE